MQKKIINYIFLASLLLSNQSIRSQDLELKVKAAFIEKFVRYTSWPEYALKNNDSLIICLTGNSKLNDIIKSFYGNSKINNYPVKIISVAPNQQIPKCQIIYLNNDCKKYLKNILDQIKNKPILILSDSDGFAENGTHINLYITDNHTVHFEINLNQVNLSGLKLNLMLVEIAKVIDQ